MCDFTVRRKDKIILLVLILAVNLSILLNHLLFINYLPISFYLVSVVISMCIAACGALLVTFILMHKITFTPHMLHIRGWDTSAGLLSALVKRKVLNIYIQVSDIRSVALNPQGNILTIHFGEGGLLKLSTDIYQRKDIKTLLLLVKQ
ncbi:hypothetical protein [Desulfotomaculum sp. 1211_IL3151]|uniref:hypothetical protein n=1 Tax=Desulfotomaculum sp. 1211_IL3151 TaxID=3084055 RepID=UPI002FDB9290